VRYSPSALYGSEGIYAPGHTPGSYILVVTSGEDSAYLLGDVRFFESIGYHPEVSAEWVLRNIAQGMLTNGEPGFWNSDLSNVGELNRVSLLTRVARSL
jgi:hypothetical protein